MFLTNGEKIIRLLFYMSHTGYCVGSRFYKPKLTSEISKGNSIMLIKKNCVCEEADH